MVRTRQGGSVLVFVLVGLVLVLVFLGGVYYIRQRTSQPLLPTHEQASSEPKKEDPSKSEGVSPADTGNESKQKDTPPKPSTNSSVQPSAAPAASATNQQAAALPQTGLTESLGPALILGSLSALCIYYAQSRYLRRSL